MVQVESTSKVMMAALAELAEKATAFKNGSAEPHVLRPLPFLIYFADQDAVRGPSPPLAPFAAPPLSLAALAAPSVTCSGLPTPPFLCHLPARRGRAPTPSTSSLTPRRSSP